MAAAVWAASAGAVACAALPPAGGAAAGAAGDPPGAGAIGERVLAASAGRHALEDRITRIVLEPAPDVPREELLDRLERGSLRLVLRDLSAERAPGALYHLYLDLGEDEEPADDDPRHVGSLNFFGVETGGATAELRSYEVPPIGPRLAGAVRAGRPLILTVRTSAAAAGPPPSLGRIELTASGTG